MTSDPPLLTPTPLSVSVSSREFCHVSTVPTPCNTVGSVRASRGAVLPRPTRGATVRARHIAEVINVFEHGVEVLVDAVLCRRLVKVILA